MMLQIYTLFSAHLVFIFREFPWAGKSAVVDRVRHTKQSEELAL